MVEPDVIGDKYMRLEKEMAKSTPVVFPAWKILHGWRETGQARVHGGRKELGQD